MKKIAQIFFIFLSISCFAQFSKTHYIPPLSGSNNVAAQEQYLYISTPSLTPVNVRINAIGVGITMATVSQNSPYVYTIGSGTDTQLMASSGFLNTPLSDKGFIIEAESLVYVAARVNAGSYNQAGSLVSKGMSALGTEFRVGAFVNTATTNSSPARYTFLSILATENNTLVEFKDIKPGVILLNNPTVGNTPASITLNRGQSYVLATEDVSIANKDGLIGALVKSNKPIAFNCGSFGGTNGNNNGNLDLGFDQIVPIENIKNSASNETKYIFVRGFGLDITERPLIVAHEDNTEVFVNEISTTILNAGQYLAIDGSLYGANGNMYVRTTKPAFAYQSVGGSSQANQEMFFVPPLNCSTPNIVNNIPFLEQIDPQSFTTNSGVNIVTEAGATLEIGINGINYPVSGLPAGVTATLKSVIANPAFEVYSITGLRGNIGAFSNKQIYVSYFGSSGAATYGGYYSGFDLKPEIISDIKIGATSSCIPDVVLKISALTAYNSFQWYKNDMLISGETSNQYTPTSPGFYQVRGSISGCLSDVFSDKIPVSECPTDLDGDKACDNIDVDNDNDGILNCTESYGNQNIDISNINSGNIAVGTYSNSYLGNVSTSITASAIPFTGSSDGSFVSEIPAGKGNSVTYTMNFAQPISVGIEYASAANSSDLLNANAEYVVNSEINKTITVLNPTNQLLIDTNYDGIYESGVTQFSSFEIRFRLNSTTPLAAGTGTFKFQTYLANSISFTHKNLLDDLPNKSALKFFATCIPKDSENDGIPDQLDSDSDNDGIPDLIEAQTNTSVAISNSDTNINGLDNNFEPGFTPFDNDKDGVLDYLDLDSDNDGIVDSAETGNDLDADGIRNYRDLDSDQDLCSDVIEAGFTDPDSDGIFGNSPVNVDINGLVNGAPYTIPNPIYLISAPIVITTQPNVAPTCELQNATISLVDNGGNIYQWQLSTDGINWIDILGNATYSGETTNTLTITSVTNAMNGYKYRVQLNKTGNSCGLTSAETILTVYALPVVNDITIVQCDDDLDAISSFNLTVKNEVISSNFANETFTYYTTLPGANAANSAQLIVNPLAFTNTTTGTMPVWARVENANGCFSVSKITLKVLATKIASTYNIKVPPTCDDFLDTNGNNNANNDKRDGIATFDLSASKSTIQSFLPTTAGVTYNINYYRNQADALSELNVITDIVKYRNIGYPNTQDIWVRVDSDVDNACYGLGPFVTVSVEKLPFANPVIIPRQCDDNQDAVFTFNTAGLETTLLGTNQSFPVTVTYFDVANNPLKDSNGVLINSPFPDTFSTKSQIIKAIVTNNTSLKCFDETTIQFIVDDLPEAFAVPVSLTTSCDDDINPLLQDGKIALDTSTFETIILNGQIGMNVKYFDGNGNLLPSPLPNPFVTGTQNVKVIVENPINATCTASTIIPFVVNPLPNINLNTNGEEDKLVCQNDPTFFVQLDAGIQDGSPTGNYSYIWSKDGTVLPAETGYTLDVNSEGLFTVEVFNSKGCTRTRTIKVTASDVAHIDSILIVDMTDINTVTVNVSGLGDYEYSLDEPSGYFQDSNFFNNVPAGIHDVYVNDKNGCRPVTKATIAVVGLPKFFTPNNDGYNDYWSPKGINASFNSKSTIYIFDRYGKLLKQWVPLSSEGWDGTFNGTPLPSDDYWYTIKLEDGREAKGHFSLKR
ncbi:MAG: T9SS type B sorting domain-containing protein [Flavobacterium sp.]|nr:T9SS type B sorting domain-containing protein [Flavobacterium sp.]